MLTVTQLARKFDVSRATVLYYERAGLLPPTLRSENGYRWYGDEATERMRAIVSYRSYGVPVTRIGTLLEHTDPASQRSILRDHFEQLEEEIIRLRGQQKAIVSVLQSEDMEPESHVSKERWVAIMRASGFDDDAMSRWHQKFEELEPQQHQKFLESLGIESAEIQRIRTYSQAT